MYENGRPARVVMTDAGLNDYINDFLFVSYGHRTANHPSGSVPTCGRSARVGVSVRHLPVKERIISLRPNPYTWSSPGSSSRPGFGVSPSPGFFLPLSGFLSLSEGLSDGLSPGFLPEPPPSFFFLAAAFFCA